MNFLVALLLALPLTAAAVGPAADRRPVPPSGNGYQVTATSYSWREPQHLRYGRLNACGYCLDDTQISADWRYYPPRTVLWVQGLGVRIVTDCGSAVRGPRHIDIHFSSLRAMRAWGTRRVNIRILGRRLPGRRRCPSGGCPLAKTSVARSATATNGRCSLTRQP